MVIVAVVVGLIGLPMILRVGAVSDRPIIAIELDAQRRRIGRVALAGLPAIAIAVAGDVGGRDRNRRDHCTGRQSGSEDSRSNQVLKAVHRKLP